MARQEESKLSKTIIDAMNVRGCWFYKNHGSVFMPKGLTDITGNDSIARECYLETKVPGKEISGVSPEQLAYMSAIIRRCPICVVSVVSSVKDAIYAVETPNVYPTVIGGTVRMLPLNERSKGEQERIISFLQRLDLFYGRV